MFSLHPNLNLSSVQHKSTQMYQFADMCEGLSVKAVTGRQVELLQTRTGLSDDLQTGLIQEVTARELQTHQAQSTGLHEAEESEEIRHTVEMTVCD